MIVSIKKTLDKAIKTIDKLIKFPSEREAIEYCRENGISERKIFRMGDVYCIRE